MVKKSQLRRMAIDQIMELITKQTDGASITLYTQTLADRNKLLLQRKDEILNELGKVRQGIERNIKDMNEGVADRMELRNKIVMHRDSRPTNPDIAELATLFTYMERQAKIATRNHQDIAACLQTDSAKAQTLVTQTNSRADSSHLDEQYYQLKLECEREEAVKQELLKQRDAKRKHYTSISDCIEQCRKEYDYVEQRIAERERELIQLSCYYNQRRQEDQQQVSDLIAVTTSLEDELLKAQALLNYQSDKQQGLAIQENEVFRRQ